VSFETLPTGKPLGLAYLCGLACFALVAGLLFEVPAVAIPAKLLASTAFVAVAIAAGALNSRYGQVLLIGLLLSWFGDAFLISETQRWFLFGLVSFLLAHIAYFFAFAVSGIDRRWVLGALVPIIGIALLVSLWLTPHLPPDMVWPVRAYTIVISLMVVMAFGTLGAGATPLIVAGACLFYLSDLSVAAMRFTDPPFPTYVLGLPLYYSGQLCLALSVATGQRETAAYS
jgi:uncharacterized membrane protein YhhN